MHQPELEFIHSLGIQVKSDGGVTLTQGKSFIELHPSHLRILLERTGHLLPADQLTRTLARHLCEASKVIAEEGAFAASGAMSGLHERLLAVRDMLPENVYPFDLYGNEAGQ